MNAEATHPIEDDWDSLVPQITQILASKLGWAVSDSLKNRIPRAATDAALSLGLMPGQFFARIHEDACLSALADACVVAETYFFRHREQLEESLSEVKRQFPAQHLRVWSAGCATGEEAYTLSYLLLQKNLPKETSVVMGTDVSPRCLAQAQSALYRQWSLRGVDALLQSEVFDDELTSDGSVRVKARIRDRVDFLEHNLLNPAPFPSVHLAICRNVLLYFSRAQARTALLHLSSALIPGGVLALGSAEFPLAHEVGLTPIERRGVTLWQKLAHRPSKPRSVPSIRARANTAPAQNYAQPASPTAPSPSPPAARTKVSPQSLFERAVAAARSGDLEHARTLAERAAVEHLPEAHLLLASLAESVGNWEEALSQTRKALYLDPHLATAHAAQLSLFLHLGRSNDARRARTNALRALEGLDDPVPLRGVEPITAGALRQALEDP